MNYLKNVVWYLGQYKSKIKLWKSLKLNGLWTLYGLLEDDPCTQPTFTCSKLTKETLKLGALYCFFFFLIIVFFHRHWGVTGQQRKWGEHLLFLYTTSTRSQTLRYLFANLHVWRLSRIFNRNACVYQTSARWDSAPYQIIIHCMKLHVVWNPLVSIHDVSSVKENIKHDMFKFSWVTAWHATGCPCSHMKFKGNHISYLMFWSFQYYNKVFDINLDYFKTWRFDII